MNANSMTRSLAARSFMATCVLAGAAVAAPSPGTAQDLPDANDLIAAYVDAIGGAERLVGQSSITRGTFSAPAMGMEGDFVLFQRYPDQHRMVMALPGVGESQNGDTGEVGWSMDPMMGPQLMEDAETARMREQTSVAGELRDPSLVPGRETVERTEFEGEACWKVKLTWASGRETHDCYSVDTGLLIATEEMQASPLGEVPSVTIFQDYREFDGRRVATRITSRFAGQEQVVVFESVDYGEVTEEQLAPPQAIQTLIGG